MSIVRSKVVRTRRMRAKSDSRPLPADLDETELCAGPEASRAEAGGGDHPGAASDAAPGEVAGAIGVEPDAEAGTIIPAQPRFDRARFPGPRAHPVGDQPDDGAGGFSGPEDPSDPEASADLPGSAGEHLLQSAFGTEARARRFYADQVLDHLNSEMVRFAARMEMLFVATADGHGECDASLRAGPAGFVQVLDDRRLAYPEYRGNGVMASLGNISENPHVGILMIDFVTDLIGLHVNGRARIVDDADLRAEHPELPAEDERARSPERWVVVEVEEAYIHCRKHIPRMAPVERKRAWDSDNVRRKGGDYFGAKDTARSAVP